MSSERIPLKPTIKRRALQPRKQLLFLLLCFGFSSHFVFADTVVIVNAKNSITSLSKSDVRSLFMGKIFIFPSTHKGVTVFDQESKSAIRDDFYRVVAGKSSRKMSSYWARYLFTGKGKPPATIKGGDTAVIEAIRKTENGIAYVDSDSLNSNSLDGSVKVVFTISQEGNI